MGSRLRPEVVVTDNDTCIPVESLLQVILFTLEMEALRVQGAAANGAARFLRHFSIDCITGFLCRSPGRTTNKQYQQGVNSSFHRSFLLRLKQGKNSTVTAAEKLLEKRPPRLA
jgi:hypothetical protein